MTVLPFTVPSSIQLEAEINDDVPIEFVHLADWLCWPLALMIHRSVYSRCRIYMVCTQSHLATEQAWLHVCMKWLTDVYRCYVCVWGKIQLFVQSQNSIWPHDQKQPTVSGSSLATSTNCNCIVVDSELFTCWDSVKYNILSLPKTFYTEARTNFHSCLAKLSHANQFQTQPWCTQVIIIFT